VEVDRSSTPILSQPPIETWEQQTVRRIKKLHAEAASLALELGRWQAAEGHDLRCTFDVCDSLEEAFHDGWNDEKAGKP